MSQISEDGRDDRPATQFAEPVVSAGATAGHGRHAAGVPAVRAVPDAAAIQLELDNDRKGERLLFLKAIIALAFVAVLVVIRQVFFV